MQCVANDSHIFSTKKTYMYQLTQSREVEAFFDRSITKSMHCIVLRVGKSRLFDRCLTKSRHCTVHRVGKLRLFDRGLTKRTHCIVHSRGFSTGI